MKCKKCKNIFTELVGNLCEDCFEDETLPQVIKNLTEQSEGQMQTLVIKPTYYFAVFIKADYYKINCFNTFIDKHPIELMIEISKRNKTLTLISWQEVDEETYIKYKNCKAITQIDQ